MWLDCDDFITEENVEKIIKLKNEKTNFDTYMFRYKVGNGSQNSITFYRERLLKNTPQAKFQGFIHEAIPPFGKIAYLDIEIEHKKENFSNPKRNLNVYKYHVKKGEQLSTRDTYYLGKEYYYNGYYYTARKILNRYLKMDGKYLPDVRDALLTLYDISVKILEKPTTKYLFTCINLCGFESEILCKIGDEKLSRGEQLLAIEFYETALNCKKDGDNKGFLKNEYYYLYPLLQLTCIYYKIGNLKKALYYHNLCLKENEDDTRVAYNQRFFKNNYKKF
jgi:tetratricopeptide (TPR) repeat protein